MSEPQPVAAVVQRVLPAAPEVVFDQWVDPEAWAEWMCPLPARARKIELEARVGGRYRIDIDDEGLQFFVAGRYVAFDRPHRLRFTWSCSIWADPDLESVVTVTLEPHGDDATFMTIHHALLPPELTAGHESGWARIAGQLDDALRAVP